MVGSVVTALVFPEVDRSPIRNSTQTIPVTAQVEQRPVRSALALSATVRAPVVATLMPNAAMTGPGGSAREVVSGRTLKVGDAVRYGDLVAEVSGRPILAMPASVPLYRDMELGVSGNDVTALQNLLASLGYFKSTVNGKFGSTTVDALDRLFRAAKYDMPKLASGKPGLPLADTTTLSSDGVRVTKVAAVGTVLGGLVSPTGNNGKAVGNDDNAGNSTAATQTLAEVEVSPAAVTSRVDLLQAKLIKTGSSVHVRVGASEPVPSTIQSVSEFQEGAASLPAGYDIVVPLPEKLSGLAKANDAATITEVADDIPKGPAVPLVSIRQDAKGSFVLLAGPDGATTESGSKRVSVTVRGQCDGYAILADNPDLPENAILIVSDAG
jgi:hypothetical protein